MKLVVDTNVFISSLFWGGNPRVIMTRIILGEDLLFTSEEILKETAGVLMRPKFNADAQLIHHFVESIREVAITVPRIGLVRNVCRDSADDKVLECALLSQSDYIITGDNDLLVIKRFHNTSIVTPNEYIRSIIRQ
jgi:putative PIN family toxin of toxin-antitoxin system